MNVWLEVREFIVYIHMHTDFLTITLNANFPLLMPRLVQECHSELVAPVWRYSNLKKVQIREGSRVFYNSMSLVMTSGHGSKTSRLAFAVGSKLVSKRKKEMLFYFINPIDINCSYFCFLVTFSISCGMWFGQLIFSCFIFNFIIYYSLQAKLKKKIVHNAGFLLFMP